MDCQALDPKDRKQYLLDVNGTLFFTSAEGRDGELWKSDGTEPGTVMVKDSIPGEGGLFRWSENWPEVRPLNLNGTLFFAGIDGLWKSDGTEAGTVLVVKAMIPSERVNFNGTLFFIAGSGLWKSDGTPGGTELVKALRRTPWDPPHLVNANGALFFSADDGEHGVQLWKYVPDSLSERPALKIARVGNKFTLSWPASVSGFILEATTDLSSSLNWSKAPDTPTIVDGEYTASTSWTSGNTFYRLKR
jgi:ELWxxDGT repeat protein